MPAPSLLYVQMLVMQLQTRDTRGARQTRLNLRVSQDSLAGSAAALHGVASHYTWLHVYARHACMSDTVRYPQTVSLRC